MPYCNICEQLTDKRIQEHQRLDCKGPPKKPEKAPKPKPDTIPAPEPEKPVETPEKPTGLESPEKVRERVKKWKADNSERHKEYMREYMREYMSKRREKAKQE